MSARESGRPRHDDRSRKTGRYKNSPPCDGCGKPVGTVYGTDDLVCGGTDGPGFLICDRERCVAKLAGLGVEARRAIYTKNREASLLKGSR